MGLSVGVWTRLQDCLYAVSVFVHRLYSVCICTASVQCLYLYSDRVWNSHNIIKITKYQGQAPCKEGVAFISSYTSWLSRHQSYQCRQAVSASIGNHILSSPPYSSWHCGALGSNDIFVFILKFIYIFFFFLNNLKRCSWCIKTATCIWRWIARTLGIPCETVHTRIDLLI